MKGITHKQLIAIVATVVPIIAVTSYLPIRRQRLNDERERIVIQVEKWDVNGTRPAVPGPYLAEGKVADLRFKVEDLGRANFIQMSENGTVLYQTLSPDGKSATSFHLHHYDGKDEIDTRTNDVQLYPSGRTLWFGQSNFNQSQKPNRKLYDRSVWYNDPMDQPTEAGIYRTPGTYVLEHSFTDGASTVFVPTEPHKSIYVLTGSSTLGAFGNVQSYGFWAETFPKYEIANIVQDKISYIDLPQGCREPWLVATKEALYLPTSSIFGVNNSWEFRNGQFTRLPSIPHTGRQDMDGANSNHEFILSIDKTPHEPKKCSFEPYYVSGGKYYSMQNMAKKLHYESLGPARPGCNIRIISEDGDMALRAKTHDGIHLVILKPIRNP